MIQEGYYRARAVCFPNEDGDMVWAQWGRASTGTLQIVMRFEILDDKDRSIAKLPWFGFFTEDSATRTIESLRYCGFQGDDLSQLNEQLLDKEVEVSVEHSENDKGKRYARVAFVNEPGGGMIRLKERLTLDELRQFSAQMRSTVANVKARSAERRAVRPDWDNPPPPTDDDLPI